jgi:hypothetical protein
LTVPRTWFAAVVICALFLGIYGDALGHGFVKDDFRWIAAADIRSPRDLQRIFSTNVGFYRPLVTLSFAIDRGIWHLDPRGYAATNLLLLTADAVLLFALARRLSLSPAVALFAVTVWLFNFHGINMALLWISGRTALLLCLFSLGAALAWAERRRGTAALLTLSAMLCKEEALLLPALLVLTDIYSGDIGVQAAPLKAALRRAWPLWAMAAIYLLVRAHSGAFGPFDAPAYYQLTLHPRIVTKNATEYLDRGATWAAVSALLMFLLVPRGLALDDVERRVVRFGVLWFGCMFAITVFVPTRSSLYAVAPSIGSALAAASLASRAERANWNRFALLSTTLIAIIAFLIPVYRLRNRGLVEPGDLSTQALSEVQRAARADPQLREIVFLDVAGAPVTLEDAFGGLIPEAIHVFVSPEVRVDVGDVADRLDDSPNRLVFELRRGRLIQARTRTKGSPADTSRSHSG